MYLAENIINTFQFIFKLIFSYCYYYNFYSCCHSEQQPAVTQAQAPDHLVKGARQSKLDTIKAYAVDVPSDSKGWW